MISRKQLHLHQVAAFAQQLWEQPRLDFLFLELTLRCNERCVHCGSRCGEVESAEMPKEVYFRFLEKIRKDFAERLPMLCITGGEPLLRKDFFEIMAYASELGFHWGMTSNGTLIDDAAAEKLEACGMRTISVSIDGLPETHDRFRGTPGGYAAAMRGIEALLRRGSFAHVQVTTIVHQQNLGELPALYGIMEGMPLDSWRVSTIEPIGRARMHPELLLTPQEIGQVLDFIREKRSLGMDVQFGCNHYLGLAYEHEVRDWYFRCNAGVSVASVMVNGDIGSCLDIERRPETVEGNILRDDFTEVWKHGFRYFRQSLSDRSSVCRTCKDREFCRGGSFHSWDFDRNVQQVCLRGALF